VNQVVFYLACLNVASLLVINVRLSDSSVVQSIVVHETLVRERQLDLRNEDRTKTPQNYTVSQKNKALQYCP